MGAQPTDLPKNYSRSLILRFACTIGFVDNKYKKKTLKNRWKIVTYFGIGPNKFPTVIPWITWMHWNLVNYNELSLRVHPRFFDRVGHETMYASSGNKHFFTKLSHPQAHQNYEQPPRTSQNVYFQSNLSDFFFYEEYSTRRPTFIKKVFDNLDKV